MEIPESIDTNNPKEAIGFCIANGIEEGILPANFKMDDNAWKVLEGALRQVWDELDSFVLNQVMVAFVAGYAAGKGLVTFIGD